jgi:hypothetical protein
LGALAAIPRVSFLGPCMGREDPEAADPCAPAGRQRPRNARDVSLRSPARRIDAAGQRPAIVVAADRRDSALAQKREGLVGERPVVEQVAAADAPDRCRAGRPVRARRTARERPRARR